MAQPRKAYEKKNKHQINQFIKATKVRLISEDGQQLGVVEINDALDQAKSASLDLVQMNDDPKTPVCKLMDYGKHLFDQKKQKAASKKKTKKTQLKEIKFRPTTDTGDYNIKLKKIKSFINDGDKTKISVRFRGREILNSNLGLDLLNRLREDLQDIAQVDQEPSLEGRQLLMVLSKIRKK